MGFSEWVHLAAKFFEAAGVAVMVIGTIVAAASCLDWRKKLSAHARYRRVRQRVGAAILLGLELLVAADIIRTIADRPTMQQVFILGGIVLIRTFLSFTLAVELEGKWPWQGGSRRADAELLSAEEGRSSRDEEQPPPPSIN